MGQFKPMVKMMTTEPSIELKLKKGGSVKKMAYGGMPDDAGAMAAAPAAPAMPARGGMGMPGAAPGRPSLMARRRAMRGMPGGAGPAAPIGAASRMMKEGGESKATHKAEMAKMGKLEKELKTHEGKPASKAHKGLKTGGVVNGQGGFKSGGIISSEGKAKTSTKMDTTKPDHSPAKTGDVKMGNGGGYATGGVAKANGGGYKKGGAAKKAFATGGVVDSGAPVAMPQGRKKPSAPVSITELSGTFKKGGKVTAAEGRLQKAFTRENATAMKQAKAYSNEVYSKYGKKMAAGGLSGQGSVTEAERRALRDAMPSEAADQIKTDRNKRAFENWERSQREENEGMRNAIFGAPKRMMEGIKGLFTPKASDGSVTKTKESVTVTPAKKRGGAVTC